MAMTSSQRLGFALGSIALLLAMVSALLSTAPFTPAVVLVVISVPLGIAAIYLSAKRTGMLAIYWSLCAILAAATLAAPGQYGDNILVAAFAWGIAGSLAALLHYVRSTAAGIHPTAMAKTGEDG